MNEGLNTLSAADVAAVTRNNDGNMWGDGGWFWIIILAFLFCGNGWGNNNGAQNAFISDEFVKRDIFNTNQNVSNTSCETQRDVLENRYTTQLGLQNLQAQQSQCCCNTQKEILQNRYDAALMAQNMQAQLAQCCCDIKETVLADGQATVSRHNGGKYRMQRQQLPSYLSPHIGWKYGCRYKEIPADTCLLRAPPV